MRSWTAKNITSFPTQHKAVTPSDTVEFQYPTAILCTVAGGNVVISDKYLNDVTYTSVPAYFVIPVMARKVKATGTTATGLVAIFGDE